MEETNIETCIVNIVRHSKNAGTGMLILLAYARHCELNDSEPLLDLLVEELSSALEY